ncbi:MAG: hypothetical protein ACLP8A_05050, partial [Methylovirgula sp.]
KFEFESFLEREAELGRGNLVFPILYIEVPGLEIESQWRTDKVLQIIHDRQFVDWQELRRQDVTAPDVAREIETFCKTIVQALRQPWQPRPAPAATQVRDPAQTDSSKVDEIKENPIRDAHGTEAQETPIKEVSNSTDGLPLPNRDLTPVPPPQPLTIIETSPDFSSVGRAAAATVSEKPQSADATIKPQGRLFKAIEWASAGVAVSIIDYLVAETGLNASMSIAAGHGHYFPLPLLVSSAALGTLLWRSGLAPARAAYAAALLFLMNSVLGLAYLFLYRADLVFFFRLSDQVLTAVGFLSILALWQPKLRNLSVWLLVIFVYVAGGLTTFAAFDSTRNAFIYSLLYGVTRATAYAVLGYRLGGDSEADAAALAR